MTASKVLITFLGRTPKDAPGYRTTQYDFGDNQASPSVAFFGWPLAERVKPERLVILGTAGSMWDHLFETDLHLGDDAEEARLALIDSVASASVTGEQLRVLEPLLSERLEAEVSLSLIPYCRQNEEQIELLRILAEHVNSGDAVDLDITHAFRHLPMLALLGSLYLIKTKNITIEHVWYGAYNEDTSKATVHDLAGLIAIANWVNALGTYDKDGDYGVFAELLPETLGNTLANAAFFENTNRLGQARGKARRVLKDLRNLDFEDPARALFKPALIERLQWVEEDRLYQRQRTLAGQHLKNGRFVEATLHAYEAFVTYLTQQRDAQPDDPAQREQARNDFDHAEKAIKPRTAQYKAWDSLRRLRNAIVHGNQPKGEEVQRALSSPDELSMLLNQLIATLFPLDPV